MVGEWRETAVKAFLVRDGREVEIEPPEDCQCLGPALAFRLERDGASPQS